MTKHSRFSRTVLVLLVFALTLSGAFAFPSIGPEHNVLPLTAVGTTNQCGTGGSGTTYTGYPDEQGVFYGSAKLITSTRSPALVNLYKCNAGENPAGACNNGNTYIGEYSAPYGFSGANAEYRYEVYWCPVLTNTCTPGMIMGVTSSTYRTCLLSGSWGPETPCLSTQYFDPAKSACVNKITTCVENWGCGSWGVCSPSGVQQRTCSDNNKCGTFTYAPTIQQACIPASTNLTAGQIRDRISLSGLPTADTLTTTANQTVTVTQSFTVKTPGTYWVEAGIEKYSGLSIATVNRNTCNPEQTWYKNAPVVFTTAGTSMQTFSLVTPGDGKFVLHTAIVTGCGGEVVQQATSPDQITVGVPGGQNDSANGLLFVYGGVALVVVLGIIYLARRK